MENDIATLLNEAALLMVVGMVVVFLFLVLLIGAVNLIAAICAKFPDTDIPSTPTRTPVASNKAVSANIVAAISAAIHQHRQGQ
ncbi:OadG family transporter subunit [Neptunicella sp. SCSIO 80796]|uniref:OadG family transporter subunit n=1 Tax=Neptunicella plasticusilytica TaxID=3117012 RepID=UPI003A4DDEB3